MVTATRLPIAATPLDVVEQRGRGGWAAAAVVVAYGVSFRLRTDDATLLPKLQSRLPPGSRVIATDREAVDLDYSISLDRSADERDGVAIYTGFAGAVPLVHAADEATLLDVFESTVRFDVAVATTEFVFVHAGVVGWNGGAIVVPAPSMHGKSRLVDALVRAGATYYSDEFAVIDRRGLVHPFGIPISIRTVSGGVNRVTVTNRCRLSPLALHVVVSTRYAEGGQWRPRRGTAAEALLALFSNTVRARIAPRETLSALARAVEGAALIESSRGEADSVASLLLQEGS